MLIPVRCFTCNQVIAHKWNTYQEKLAEHLQSGMTEMDANKHAMDDVEIPVDKYCCRRMLLSHVNVIDRLLDYSNNPGEATAPIDYPEPLPEDYEEAPPESSSDSEDEDEVGDVGSDNEEDDEVVYHYSDSDSEDEVGEVYSDDEPQDYTFIE